MAGIRSFQEFGQRGSYLLREVDEHAITTLLDGLLTKRVEHAKLRFFQPVNEGVIKGDLTIMDAQFADAMITVHVRVSCQSTKQSAFRVVS